MYFPPTYIERLRKQRDRWCAAACIGWTLLVVVVVLFTLAGPCEASAQSPETWAAAYADRQQFQQSDWGYLYYLSSDHQPPAKQLTTGRVAAFVIASFSKALVLEHHLPVEVAPGLWRIDLRGLEWRWQDWHKVLERYPYAPHKKPAPLIVRADWLTVELGDNFDSQSGYLLLYKGKPPANLNDFKAFWRIEQGDPNLALFHIEQESGVSLLDIRWVENSDTPDRGRYFGTQDNDPRNFNAKTDPLETLLDKQRQHDASEHIIQFPKISLTGAGGVAQQYFLANGKGIRQDRAPVNIVEDHSRFRGLAEVRNFGSCVTCHTEGLKRLGKNDLRDLIENGEELYADKKSQKLIEQHYLAKVRLDLEISRANEDYAVFTALTTGWSPEELSRAFGEVFADYDSNLTLEDAARELYVTPDELTLALGYASQKQVKLGARLAGLPHGRNITRDYWESQFHIAWAAVQLWQGVGK